MWRASGRSFGAIIEAYVSILMCIVELRKAQGWFLDSTEAVHAMESHFRSNPPSGMIRSPIFARANRLRKTTKRTYLTERQQTVDAITYIVDRKHQQYAGALSPENILPHVLEGNGISGHCVDYVMNTVNHLRDMEIHDTTLEAVVERL
jgi:ChaC-like protein